MPDFIKKTLTILSFLSLTYFPAIKSFPQKGYWYTSAKVPVIDFIAYAITNRDHSTETNKFDGIAIDLGRGFRIKKALYLETGIQYYTGNYYRKNIYSGNSPVPYSDDQTLTLNNSSFSVQLKPLVVIPIGDEENKNNFRIGLSLNGQKLYSNYSLSGYKKQDNGDYSEFNTRSSSKPYLSLFPVCGFQLQLSEHYSLGFDLNYIKIDWGQSMKKLQISSNPTFPERRTNNLFLSGRIIID